MRLKFSFILTVMFSCSFFSHASETSSSLKKEDFHYTRGLFLMEASSEYFKRVEILRMEDGEKQAKRDLRQLFKEELKKATDDSRERSKNENQEEFFYDDLNIRKRSYKDLIKIYAFHFRDEAIFTLIKADEKFEEAENLVKNNPKLNLNTPQVRAIILEAKMILINEMLKRKILTS